MRFSRADRLAGRDRRMLDSVGSLGQRVSQVADITASALGVRAVILRALLSVDARESVSGDLLEEYRESRVPAAGEIGADLWYWRQVGGMWLRAYWGFVVTAVLLLEEDGHQASCSYPTRQIRLFENEDVGQDVIVRDSPNNFGKEQASASRVSFSGLVSFCVVAHANSSLPAHGVLS